MNVYERNGNNILVGLKMEFSIFHRMKTLSYVYNCTPKHMKRTPLPSWQTGYSIQYHVTIAVVSQNFWR